MGLFSNIIGNSSSNFQFNKQESLVGFMLSIVASDGHISDEEVNDFIQYSNKINILKNIGNKEFNEIIDKVFKVYNREGLDSLIDKSAEGLPNDMKLGVFTICCDLAYSDGFIEKEEENVLEKIVEYLSIDNDTAMNIVDVISTKNKI